MRKTPLIQNLSKSKVNIKIRQKVLFLLFKEYQRIYASLPDTDEKASEETEREEVRIHNESSTHTYANVAANFFSMLKKRRPFEIEEKDKEVTEKAVKKAKLQTLYQKALELILTPDQLMKLDYPRDVDSADSLDNDPFSISPIPDRLDCDRCSECFEPKPLKEMSKEEQESCRYHVGKLISKNQVGASRAYTCCDLDAGFEGCVNGPHVFSFREFKDMRLYYEFRSIRSTEAIDEVVLALDCEMAYTTKGMEVIRITVVDVEGTTLLDSMIETVGSIVDYNSRWSGITHEKYEESLKKSLREIQELLFELMNSDDAILVGHSLDSDLKALRISHQKVIDTSILYEHPRGLPYKFSLQALTRTHLRRFIQEGDIGHDSAEDAIAALDLLKYYIETQGKV